MLVVGLLALFTHGCGREPAAAPNLLLISIDTLRADRLACYGGEPDVGAEICALAEGGTRFAWAFAAAPLTPPSVASLLTSRYPAFHGVTQVTNGVMRPDALTVALVLRDAGYTTAAFVSNPVLDARRNFDRGFDVYDERMSRRERNRKLFERTAKETTDAALAWAQTGPATPWFAWVHYQDPHGPYDPPGGSPARDAPGDETLPLLSKNSAPGGIPLYQALPGLRTRAAYERRYLDEIRHLDAHVRRLVAGLDALGERPAVLLTSDHGEAFGEDDFYFAHGHSVGLDQIRVPLLWRPRSPGRSRVVETPVSLIDVAPTLLREAGVAIPGSFQGRGLPLDTELAGGAPRPIFAEHRQRVAVVLGDAYWSRDRNRRKASWYRARSARLAGEGALPAYAFPDPEALPSLEPVLRSFIEKGSAQPAGDHLELPDELRERLRALGYEEPAS